MRYRFLSLRYEILGLYHIAPALIKTKTWVKIETPSSIPKQFSSVVCLKQNIYCVGDGFVWRYQPSIDTWKKLKLDIEVVEGFCLTVANNRVIISGGKLPNPEVVEKVVEDDADDFDMVTDECVNTGRRAVRITNLETLFFSRIRYQRQISLSHFIKY